MKYYLFLFCTLFLSFAFGQQQKQPENQIKIFGDEIKTNMATEIVEIIGNASFVTEKFQIENADSIIWEKENNELCIEGTPIITANSIRYSESWKNQTIHYDLEDGSLIMN